jgi:ADP-dependent NAD(P)H-hydrate dehydratase / NAD(P)H-hydrate epimerase
MFSCQVLDQSLIQSYFKKRPIDAHKGLFGNVLVIGSDYGMPGAVRLAAEGALRVGAGLVTAVTRAAHVPIIVSGRPELLCYGIEQDLAKLQQLLQQATFVLIGPGLGKSSWAESIFNLIYNSKLPMLIDADGLYWLGQSNYIANQACILTPHPGEAARLLNTTVTAIQNDREKSVCKLQEIYGGVVVLKGAQTLIAASDGRLSRCDAGNPGMASAGMGDLLSGIIAGHVAQGLDLYHAAQAGVFFHAIAGDKVATMRNKERGLLASDLLEFI